MNFNPDGPSLDPPESEEAWEAEWDAAIATARSYGWPEDAIQDVIIGQRVSYADRLAAVERAQSLWAKGKHWQALWELKITRVKVPAPPEMVDEIKTQFGHKKEMTTE